MGERGGVLFGEQGGKFENNTLIISSILCTPILINFTSYYIKFGIQIRSDNLKLVRDIIINIFYNFIIFFLLLIMASVTYPQ